MAGLTPDAVVVVGTVRALKMHGGLDKKQLVNEDLAALEKGIPNLLRHVNNIKNVYQLPCVVAINRFPTDTDAEIDFIIRKCRELGVNTVLSTLVHISKTVLGRFVLGEMSYNDAIEFGKNTADL